MSSYSLPFVLVKAQAQQAVVSSYKHSSMQIHSVSRINTYFTTSLYYTLCTTYINQTLHKNLYQRKTTPTSHVYHFYLSIKFIIHIILFKWAKYSLVYHFVLIDYIKSLSCYQWNQTVLPLQFFFQVTYFFQSPWLGCTGLHVMTSGQAIHGSEWTLQS